MEYFLGKKRVDQGNSLRVDSGYGNISPRKLKGGSKYEPNFIDVCFHNLSTTSLFNYLWIIKLLKLPCFLG